MSHVTACLCQFPNRPVGVRTLKTTAITGHQSSLIFVQIEPWCSISDGAVSRPSRLKPTSVKYKRLILFSAIPITGRLCEEHRHAIE